MPSRSSPRPSTVSPPSLDGHRPHILAINNDPAVLALCRDLLEEAGYQVSTQTYVDRDVAQIKALEPDLIVLDYMWANEDASWSLLQMLRMDPAIAAIPIVLCTGAVREVKLYTTGSADAVGRMVSSQRGRGLPSSSVAFSRQTRTCTPSASSASRFCW
jgi:CheY-like chemotaxis protein